MTPAGRAGVVTPSPQQHAHLARKLADVIALAEALPVAHERRLRYPRVARTDEMTLPERLALIHRALAKHRIPHAFGGAIALAYWTLDPRGTNDIDLNVFLPAERSARVIRALPAEIARPDGLDNTIARDGQVRIWWDETPLDLFFDRAPVHVAAARHRQVVPFAGTKIPILGPVELAVSGAKS